MIYLYSGTPGSGKSLHLARRIERTLTIYKMPVIANFPINTKLVSKNGKKKIADFVYKTNDEITVEFLEDWAFEHHKAGKESQSLLVIDEAGLMFNSRDYGSSDRKTWLKFLSLHRHYGFDIILVSQHDRMIDRQARALVEYEVKHRKANNFGFIGFLLTLLRIPFFVAVEMWYGMRLKTGQEFFRYRKRDSKLYDTMMLFSDKRFGQRIGGTTAAATSPDGDTGASGGGDPSGAEHPQSMPEILSMPETAELTS